MFEALEMSLEVLERLATVETRIRGKSRDLAGPLARASESVALNLGEGRRRRDGDRRRHYDDRAGEGTGGEAAPVSPTARSHASAGSASEVTVALRIAVAKRYITTAEHAAVDEPLDRVRAMLYRLTR